MNLCSFKLLIPNRNLVNKRRPAKLQILKFAKDSGRITLVNLRIPKSSLFHSRMVHGKNELLNESVLLVYTYMHLKGLYGNVGVLISDNSLSSQTVINISNFGSVSSNWNSQNVKGSNESMDQKR